MCFVDVETTGPKKKKKKLARLEFGGALATRMNSRSAWMKGEKKLGFFFFFSFLCVRCLCDGSSFIALSILSFVRAQIINGDK